MSLNLPRQLRGHGGRRGRRTLVTIVSNRAGARPMFAAGAALAKRLIVDVILGEVVQHRHHICGVSVRLSME